MLLELDVIFNKGGVLDLIFLWHNPITPSIRRRRIPFRHPGPIASNPIIHLNRIGLHIAVRFHISIIIKIIPLIINDSPAVCCISSIPILKPPAGVSLFPCTVSAGPGILTGQYLGIGVSRPAAGFCGIGAKRTYIKCISAFCINIRTEIMWTTRLCYCGQQAVIFIPRIFLNPLLRPKQQCRHSSL